MLPILVTSLLVVGAVLAALLVTLGMASAVQFTSRRDHGYMHLAFYAILLIVALTNFFSGRDLTTTALSFKEPEEVIRNPLMVLAQPLVSLFLLTIAGERIITHWLQRQKDTRGFMPTVLMMTFILYWSCTVAAPALWGAHPAVSYYYIYPLVIGAAALLVNATERDLAFVAARNALLLFMGAGLLLIPFATSRVLDISYMQGLLPGVPRFAGLAPHGVSMGMLAQLALLCLLAYPFRRAWLNWLAWATGLGVLFLAQSKTAWISFVLCLVCMIAVRKVPTLLRRAGDPMRPEFGMVSLLVFMAGVLTVTLVVMFGDLGARLGSFFDSTQGAQLASLTGRDQIWAIAYDEWQRNPVFGYGPNIWDATFRISIGMPYATHGHNQFMDTLSRSGTVGAVALVLYALVLLVLSIRYARATHGISVALFLAMALRSISEVPLLMFVYDAELLNHVLLLMTLAVAARQARATSRAAQAHTPVNVTPLRSYPSPARHPLGAP